MGGKGLVEDVNDITKGEARVISRCSTSFFSSSTSSSSAAAAPPASSPAAATQPSKKNHRQLYGTSWRTRLVKGLTSTSSPELTSKALPPEELLEDGVEEDEGVAPPDLVETSLLDS